MAGQISNNEQSGNDSIGDPEVPHPALPVEWHFLQCFGQPNAAEAAPNGTHAPLESYHFL